MKKIIHTIFYLVVSTITLNAQIAEIPFELKKGLVLLKLKINKSNHTNTFIFDSGATSDVMDYTTAKTLGLMPNHKENVEGAGGSQSYDVVLNQTISLHEEIVIDSTHLVLTNLTRLKNALGRDFDGIFGYSLLRKYITKIDYENKKMSFFNDIKKVDTVGYKSIPFKLEDSIPIPQFEIEIKLNNGESFKGNILFDSGAGLTLLVNTPFNEKHQLSEKSGKSLTVESENLGSKSISEDISIKSLTIAGFELGEMEISIANDKVGVSSYEGYLGILGAQVISQFDIILDYFSSTLYLKPNIYYNN